MPTSRSGFGLQANGTLYAWGNAITTGTSSTGSVASPIQVVGAHKFISVEGSYNHTLALKDNGQVWGWGVNTTGELGTGAYAAGTSSPVQVVGSHSFSQIFTGYQCSVALKENGQVWCWGANAYGQLGSNNITSYNSPVLVVGAHSFVRLMGGSQNFYGTKDTNIVWAWGRNDLGQLGDGTILNRSSPVLIIGNHSFSEIRTSGYHCLALKDDGQAWAWGANSWGQLGTGSLTAYSSPVQVIGNHSFIAITAEYEGSSYGLKVDGSLWAWGYNNYGQLGQGNITNYSSPVKVIGNHSFIGISTGQQNVRALKSNGAIWSWGNNAEARCGIATAVSYASPVLTVGPMSYTKLYSGISISVAVSGVWRKRPTAFVHIGGVWYKVLTLWTLKSGNWVETDSLNK
jgi:alpha-tubulin suppressor-like RCC1 family protein